MADTISDDERERLYQEFEQNFPSNALLCDVLGVKDTNELFERYYTLAAKRIERGDILAVFPSDVAIARASADGVLTSRHEGDKEILVLDKEKFRETAPNLLAQQRYFIQSALRSWAMGWFQDQGRNKNWDGVVRPYYVFEKGEYGEVVLAYNPRLPDVESFRLKLCREFAEAIEKYQLYTDVWWEYKVEGNSIWLQPKELTDELKAAMQKEYDEERAKVPWASMVTKRFYPGWKPDTSNDPQDD